MLVKSHLLHKSFLLLVLLLLVSLLATRQSSAQEGSLLIKSAPKPVRTSLPATRPDIVTVGATLEVTNVNDSGPGSLRQAVLDAASGDIIVIAPILHGQSLVLESDLPDIDKRITIDGTSAPFFTIDGNNTYRSGFIVHEEGDLTARGLTFFQGSTEEGHGGGAFASAGGLNLQNVSLLSNTASYGGAIFNYDGQLKISNSTLHSNSAVGDSEEDGGGAINQYGDEAPSTEIWYSTITDNTSVNDVMKSGLWIENDEVEITASILDHAGNSCLIESGAVVNSGGYNIDYDTTSGGNPCSLDGPNDLLDSDPKLGPLTDNGGANLTRSPSDLSPAFKHIPAGTAECGLDYQYDQRGGLRAIAGSCDSGSVEYYVCLTDIGTERFISYDHTPLDLAIGAAVSGQTIQVAGLCQGTTAADSQSNTVVINKDITLQGMAPGPFNASEISLVVPSSSAEYPILDAKSIGRVIIVRDNTTTITNVTLVRGNPSNADGGGLSAGNGADVTVTGVLIRNNQARTGGGVFSDATAKLTVANSTFVGNSADSGGAAGNESTLELNSSTLSGNEADSGGGVFNAANATLTVGNSTFSGNNSGAIENHGTLTLSSSTISDNTAASTAGGVENEGSMTLRNNVLAKNTGGDCANSGGSFDIGYSLIEDGSCDAASVSSNLIGDPKLGPLADNGGPTLTFALLDGSPAIDSGSNVDCAASPIYNLDQRGKPRLGVCDMGAYEWGTLGKPEMKVFLPVVLGK